MHNDLHVKGKLGLKLRANAFLRQSCFVSLPRFLFDCVTKHDYLRKAGRSTDLRRDCSQSMGVVGPADVGCCW